jgi:cyanophycin synthetase
MRELGAIAARYFDVVVVREDDNLRGRQRGETAELVAEGVRASVASGARCKQLEVILDEISAVRHCMTRANPGDLVVLCVDKHGAVVAELETLSHQAQSGAHVGDAVADPDAAVEPHQEPALARGGRPDGYGESRTVHHGLVMRR